MTDWDGALNDIRCSLCDHMIGAVEQYTDIAGIKLTREVKRDIKQRFEDLLDASLLTVHNLSYYQGQSDGEEFAKEEARRDAALRPMEDGAMASSR